MSILPTDTNKKRKLRATIQMQLGRYYLERLIVGSTLFLKGSKLDLEVANKKFIEFSGLPSPVKFPPSVILDSFKDIEDAKQIFRLANTQFKRSLDFFKLDGYVTEHVQMQQDVSRLYKHLS